MPNDLCGQLLTHLLMANNQKNMTVPPDELIHDELDEVNKKQYYKAVESELREICKAEGGS